MRSYHVFVVLVIVSLAGLCITSTSANAQGYYGDVVYYSAPQVVYYQAYRPAYDARPVYYGRPLYYSYYSPSCVYYVRPVYCEPTPSYERSDSSGYSSRQPSQAQPTTTVTVGAYDNRFEPQTINVQPGATVRWVNNGQHAHTVTADDDSWDSGDIQPGASYSATFKRPGTYNYYCRHHTQDRMQGVVVVGASTANENGGASSAGASSPGARSSGY
jgi:plastocyanin